MAQKANTVFRDFVTDGVPSSGNWDPSKPDIRALLTALENGVAGAAAGATIYDSKADMVADTSQAANAMAWVLGDATAANNGVYQFDGTDTWTRLGDLPYSYIMAANAGAGTADAIVATTSIPVPAADGAALIALPIVADNTASPVTVAFNGGTTLTVKTASGNDVAAGSLTSGMIVAGYVSGSTFRMLSDQASTAIQAAAETAAAAAEAAAASIDYLMVADRIALKVVNTDAHTVAYLKESGREGVFKWRASDLSTEVSVDTAEGIYVASASDATGATGAWVRQGGWAVTGADINWFYETADADDYSVAVEAAAAVTGLLTAKAGDYQIVAGVTWPAKNITLRCAGPNQVRFHGGAAALFTWPTSVTDANSNVVTQNVYGVMIEPTGDNIGLKIHQTWSATGKIGPKVSGCIFVNSSATTTTARAISLQGVWTAGISENWFFGMGPTGGVGGHGVYIDLDDDMNTSVMNVSVCGNQFIKMGSALWVEDRTGDGRVEGISFTGNKVTAGWNGVRLSQSLSSIIVGNMLDCSMIGIQVNYDFDFVITGNVRIAGLVAGINLVSGASGILERGTITGNQIQAVAGSVGIKIDNDVGNSVIRNITINGNAIGHGTTDTGIGIQFNGAYQCTNFNINGNVFEGLSIGIDYNGGNNSAINVTNNNWTAVATKINNPSRSGTLIDKQYLYSILPTLVGGAASETFDIDISSAAFSAKPAAVLIDLDGSFLSGTTRLLKAGYDYANAANSASSAHFVVCNSDGSNITPGPRRFTIVCHGQGYATQ